MPANIFAQSNFVFPYNYKFPGQSEDERILFVTRENQIMLQVRRLGVVATAVVLVVVGASLTAVLLKADAGEAASLLLFGVLVLAASAVTFGWWWVSTLWQRSLCIVTTKRLTKFIYTTPFNRHNLSLPLDMIVDTGSYTKGYVQALFKLGTFTARSAAASSGFATDDEASAGGGHRINRKYFYIENITHAEDLQHYIAKLLDAHKYHRDYLASFRPFIPHLKGEARLRFMENYPEFWS